MISSVEYKDSTFTLTLFYFLSSSHSIHSKIKWKTDSHIHIVFIPNKFTLLFILLEILFIPFLSNNYTQHCKNSMEPLLNILLFHLLQRLVQFSSVTSWRGFCFTISLMGSLSVLGCVFYASPKFNHEYSASLRSCGQIDFPFASRHFSRPLQIGRVHIEFV